MPRRDQKPYRTRLILWILSMAILAIPHAVWAKTKATVAVLPFSVNSSENIDYVRQGIWDMLSSRIAANENITVLSKEKVTESLGAVKAKDLSLTDVYGMGKKMNADYAVWGSITKIGNSVSIDGKLVDIAAYKTPVGIYSQSQGMDDVIVKVNDFAKRIDQHITGGPAAVPAPQTAGTGPVAAPIPLPGKTTSSASSREVDLITGMRKGRTGTLTGAINPDFIRGAMPLDKKGFWMSLKYPAEFRGLDVGDVNGDGLNEIVAIDNNSVYVFQKKDNNMVLLQKIAGKRYDKYLGVDVFNLTEGKVKDIIVSNVYSTDTETQVSNTIQSFILSWRDGQFVKVAENLPWIFRAINHSGTTRLLGQTLSGSADSPTGYSRPFQTPIFEMVWRDGKPAEGQRYRIPGGLCIYGLTVDNLGEGADKVIALNTYDRLIVIEPTDKDLSRIQTVVGGKEILFKSEDVYGGSNVYLPMFGQDDLGDDSTKFHVYLNPRILTYDMSKTGKRDILISRNDSPAGRLFKNVKIFTSSEFVNLQWDSLGLSENWRTRKLSGYAADYQIKDVDNDGEDEIVIALVTSAGSLLSRSSVIITYKLSVEGQ